MQCNTTSSGDAPGSDIWAAVALLQLPACMTLCGQCRLLGRGVIAPCTGTSTIFSQITRRMSSYIASRTPVHCYNFRAFLNLPSSCSPKVVIASITDNNWAKDEYSTEAFNFRSRCGRTIAYVRHLPFFAPSITLKHIFGFISCLYH